MITFGITCKYNGNDWIFQCIDSIKSIYGSEVEVLLVDSNSPDKSYLKRLDNCVKIVSTDNENYMTGGMWKIYEEFERDEYYFIHDNIQLLGDISLNKHNLDVNCMGFFRCKCEFGYRWDSKEQFNWVIDELNKHTTIPVNGDFYGIFGPMLFIKRGVLDNILETGFNNILPSTKIQECGMERAWGIVLNHLGYDISFRSFYDFDIEERRIYDIVAGKPMRKLKGTGNRQ